MKITVLYHLKYSLFFVIYRETYVLPQNELTIEPVVGRFLHSEGPLWHYWSQALSFVDIVAQKVCVYHTIQEERICGVVGN